METNLKIVVDDGTREIPLVNKFGKLICKVYIRPGDYAIIDRYNDMVKGLDEMVGPLKNISIKNDGTATFEEDWEVIKAVEADLKNRINTLFDMDEADEIFKVRSPFASVGGEFFCTRVIQAFGALIADAIQSEAAASEEKYSKYLSDMQE